MVVGNAEVAERKVVSGPSEISTRIAGMLTSSQLADIAGLAASLACGTTAI